MNLPGTTELQLTIHITAGRASSGRLGITSGYPVRNSQQISRGARIARIQEIQRRSRFVVRNSESSISRRGCVLSHRSYAAAKCSAKRFAAAAHRLAKRQSIVPNATTPRDDLACVSISLVINRANKSHEGDSGRVPEENASVRTVATRDIQLAGDRERSRRRRLCLDCQHLTLLGSRSDVSITSESADAIE